MLFNLFGKTKEETPGRIFIDKVYISTEAKMNACLHQIKVQPNTLFIAWFVETAATFKAFFAQHDADDSCIIEARTLHAAKLINRTPFFLEHYPLHEKELALVTTWPEQKITVFSALDEPLFKHFGSDKMIPLIKMMGMKEDEAIEHALVTQSVIKGQQKIASQVIVEHTAKSQGEWMERNLKP